MEVLQCSILHPQGVFKIVATWLPIFVEVVSIECIFRATMHSYLVSPGRYVRLLIIKKAANTTLGRALKMPHSANIVYRTYTKLELSEDRFLGIYCPLVQHIISAVEGTVPSNAIRPECGIDHCSVIPAQLGVKYLLRS